MEEVARMPMRWLLALLQAQEDRARRERMARSARRVLGGH